MHEYYFANYRLLVDDAISSSDRMDYLAGFRQVMPATHTFTLHLGDEALLETKIAEATACPIVCTTDTFNIHDTQDAWTFVSLQNEEDIKYHPSVLSRESKAADEPLVSRFLYHPCCLRGWHDDA